METPFDRRENNLDAIRLLLAILVIFSHSYPLGSGFERLEPIVLFTRDQTSGGSIAVDLFFVISGFLITASFERSSSLLSYLRKRVQRIYPAFIVVMLLAVFIALPISGGKFVSLSDAGRLANFILRTIQLKEFSYAQAFAGNPYPGVINGAVWTIPSEFACYIGVALLGLLGILRQRWILTLLLAASFILTIVASIQDWHPDRVRLLPPYMAGILFYRFRDKVKLRPTWFIISLAALMIASRVNHIWFLIFPFAGTYILFFLAFHPRIRLHNFALFGDFSYGTYLYGFPVQQLIMRGFGHPVRPILLFLSALPAALVLAVASWYGVEKWFLTKATGRSSTAFVRASDPAIVG